MAVRSLDQVLAEINSLYEPQIQSLRSQQALIPQSVAEEEKGLKARQNQAFDEILGGARRRGLGFSGIPLSEQAKYTSTEFLPALARLKQGARQQATTLEDAILGINERRGTLAQSLRQQDVDNDYRERVFAEEKRRADEALAESRRQAAAGGFSPSYGGGGAGGAAPTKAPGVPPKISQDEQNAYNDVAKRRGQPLPALASDYQATLRSANYGNVRDKYKIMFYHQLYPEMFKSPGSVPGRVTANGTRVTF